MVHERKARIMLCNSYCFFEEEKLFGHTLTALEKIFQIK